MSAVRSALAYDPKNVRTEPCFRDAPSQRAKTRVFHELWTSAVGEPGYCKADWRDLVQQLRKEGLVE